MRKENRDQFWASLSKEVKAQHKRRSTRNQLLHPMYVEDWPTPLSKEDKGFGNNLYRTYFSVLYSIEEKY